MLHANRRLSTIQSLWLLSVLSVQDGAHRVPAGPRFLLHVYLLFSHVSFVNTFKHVKDALYVILWFLYCLGFLFIEQILFVIYIYINILGWFYVVESDDCLLLYSGETLKETKRFNSITSFRFDALFLLMM